MEIDTENFSLTRQDPLWNTQILCCNTSCWLLVYVVAKNGPPHWIFPLQYNRSNNNHNATSIITGLNGQYWGAGGAAAAAAAGGGKTVGRWLKDRKEKKKEETRAHNAQLHAAVSVAGVAAAVAAIAAATAASSGSGKDEQMAKTDMAVASAATLVAAQCVEAAEAMGAERDHLASVVSSAVNVRSAGDITTLTAAAATGMRMTIETNDTHFNCFNMKILTL